MGWIDKIATTVNSALSALRPPVIPIPPILLLCEILDRPGLSAISLTSAIISRLPEAGIPTGVNPDGSANMVTQFVKVFSEELVKEIKNNAVVNCAMPPGALNITGTAVGVGGGAVTASNTGFGEIMGLVR